MQPYTACLQINRLKILVCGDKGVGKTSLIHAFRDDRFTENVQETGEMVCRMHYIQERRTLFQMVELHIGKLLPTDAHNAHAIMLLFDDDSPTTLQRMREFWYSKINLFFSHVPLFLVRSKCDLKRTFTMPIGECMKNSMHALRFFECSAKEMNGVKYVFFEVHSALKPKSDAESKDDFNLPMSTTEAASAVIGKLGSAGPLLRQIMINARECITNPDAFADIKGSIDSYLPYSIFGSTTNVKQKTTCKVEKQQTHKNENVKPCTKANKEESDVATARDELNKQSQDELQDDDRRGSIGSTQEMNSPSRRCYERRRKIDIVIVKDKSEEKNEPTKKAIKRTNESAAKNDDSDDEEET